jgi:eukaryotic-like serine/threonine-protein kinase
MPFDNSEVIAARVASGETGNEPPVLPPGLQRTMIAEAMREGDVVAGRFVVDRLAGSGGMGAVYRARDRQSDALVALKVMSGDEQDTRFEQEARVLADLNHAAIVRYLAHGTHDARPFLAMEWLEGEDLRARLLRERLSVADTMTIARRITEALSVAHARGVVHRDIKPGNLFLPDNDPARLKVLDFGIARAREGRALDSTVVPITRTGMVIGTVGYMAPEQARGANNVDARADVFALGCVLFVCLTGRPAFIGANPVAVLAKVLLEEAPRARHFEPTVPPQLDELIARMMAKDPAARPRDAAAVLRALETADASRAASSSSSGVGDREQRIVTIVLARGVESQPEDGEAITLADGAMLIEFRGHDPATRAAACALSLRASSIAIATARLSSTNAYGPIIDRVATLVGKGVLIDDVTATLLGDRFEVVSGVLVGRARAGTAPRTVLGKRTPYVGRDKELALVEATFCECAGEPIARGVLVTGVAGSGKTRLAHELLARVRDDATVVIARGDPVGAGSALGLARQLVRNAAGLRDGDAHSYELLRRYFDQFFSGDALDRVAEMLGELVDAPSPTPSAQLRAARDDVRALSHWLSRSFGDWIRALCEEKPLLIVVEDLHWGDGATVAYLDEILRANAARPLMVLALARPEVHDLFPDLWSRAGVQEIRLAGLTKRAAERLVRSVLPDINGELAARIIERADGNAFHLEELIRHVADGGGNTLPDTVLSLADARIARLDPEARRFLRVASVFGETFWEDGVATALASEVTAVLPRLIEAELVVVGPGRKFAREHSFRHGLLRDAAYAMLAEDDRAQLHLRAADWLETAGEKDPLVLAEHYERAGALSRAAPHFLRAAEEAMESVNVRASLILAERATHCAPTGEVLGAIRTVQALGAAANSEHRNALSHAKAAFELLEHRSPRWYVAAACALSCGLQVGDFELAPMIVQEMLTARPKGRPTPSYGMALRMVADVLDSVGQRASTEALLANADALVAESTDVDPSFLAYLEFARTGAILRRDLDLGVAFVHAERGTEYAASVGDVMNNTFFGFGMGMLELEVGQHTRGRDYLRQAAARFVENGTTVFASWCGIHVGFSYYMEGRYDEALAVIRPILATTEYRHASCCAALSHLGKGELTEASRVIARALDGLDDVMVTPFVVSTIRGVAARIALALGDLDRARVLIEDAYNTPMRDSVPGVMSFLDRTRIDVVLARGERERARDLIAKAVERIERQARSLDETRRASYLALPDHIRVFELRADAGA